MKDGILQIHNISSYMVLGLAQLCSSVIVA